VAELRRIRSHGELVPPGAQRTWPRGQQIHDSNCCYRGRENRCVLYVSPGQLADTKFHAYGVIWSPNVMQFYIDDPTRPFLIKSLNDLPSGDPWPFNAQIFLLMTVGVGGTLGGSTTGLVNPQPLMADYVRVYWPSAVTKPTLGTPPSISGKAGATTGNSSSFTRVLHPEPASANFLAAPDASCAITTADADPLNHSVANSSPAERVTVSVTTTANSVLPPLRFYPKVRIWLPIAIAGLLALTIVGLVRRMRSGAWRFRWMLVAGWGYSLES